jgi:catechol 2,3-dioxygenase-like lactoylglutathione lyase family enzyme
VWVRLSRTTGVDRRINANASVPAADQRSSRALGFPQEQAGLYAIVSLPIPSFARKEADMESMISDLVTRFEKGSLSRRELVQGLALLTASGTAAAQERIDFKSADIDHVSIQVADLQRSVDFYQKMFGFSVISQDQPHGIIRLGNTRTLVSLNHESPAGIVDHFAIGIPRFTRELATNYLKQRGATPLNDPFAGLHIKDPDGINVQIFDQR